MNWVQNKDIFEIKDPINSLPTHAVEGYATVNSVKPEEGRDAIPRSHRLYLKKQPWAHGGHQQAKRKWGWMKREWQDVDNRPGWWVHRVNTLFCLICTHSNSFIIKFKRGLWVSQQMGLELDIQRQYDATGHYLTLRMKVNSADHRANTKNLKKKKEE